MTPPYRGLVAAVRPYGFRLLSGVLLVAILFQTACGTLLYPERRGQPRGRIDPGVAILNGIGLLLFVVPGVVAFAVDFSTGAIYLPPEESDREGDGQMRVLRVDPDDLTRQQLSRIIETHRERSHLDRSGDGDASPERARRASAKALGLLRAIVAVRGGGRVRRESISW